MLVEAGHPTQRGALHDVTVPSQSDTCDNRDIVLDDAIVSDVGIGHDVDLVANSCGCIWSSCALVNRHKLSDGTFVTDDDKRFVDIGSCSLETMDLRSATEYNIRVYLAVAANVRRCDNSNGC